MIDASIKENTPTEIAPPLPGFEHINRYWDRQNDCTAAKILPGEYYISNQNEFIVTVLGSCVAACIRSPNVGIGGMNHFMLPNSQDFKSSKLSESARFGSNAMELLINEILKNGGDRESLELKIFGGGEMFESTTKVGRKNIAFVHQYVKDENLNLVAEDVGLTFPRKVYYHPLTGRARVKKLREIHNNTIIEREKMYDSELKRRRLHGDVQIFK